MCGIGGGVVLNDDGRVAEFVGRCRMEHRPRGPDADAGVDARVGPWTIRFGHRRLAVVDVSDGAGQPMARGNLLVVYNGEIYNYLELREELAAAGQRFETRSDTEVILAAYQVWGREAVSRFRGMFAFALLDRACRRLLLVRDRFGVKPLFYHAESARLLFSSTARPIASFIGKGPNLSFIQPGLRSFEFDDNSESTPYERVASVRPGHVYVVDLSTTELLIEKRPFYDLATQVRGLQDETRLLDPDRAILQCAARVQESVRLRLRADVGIAVTLSGGTDSSLITAVARRLGGGPVIGYCYGHPDDPASEGPLAARVGRHTGLEVRWVSPPADTMARLFWATLDAQDAPFSTGSIVAQFAVYQAAHRDGFKVVLGGQGADEAFLGYRKAFVWSLLESLARSRLSGVGRALGDLAVTAVAEWPNAGRYARLAARRWEPRNGLRREGRARRPSTPSGLGRDVAARQILDIERGGLPTLLRYEDRNSMANSVESRLPFMDHELVEWAVALPAALKIRQGYGKWILRRVLSQLVPDAILPGRAKRGFDVRIEPWLRAGLGMEIRGEINRLRRRLEDAGLGTGDVGHAFSDSALADSAGRVAEATALIWIGRQLE